MQELRKLPFTKFKCQFCVSCLSPLLTEHGLSDLSVVFRSKDRCQIPSQMTCLKVSVCGRIYVEVGGCPQASLSSSVLILPPTCFCKEVGGYMTRYARIATSITQISKLLVT